MAELLTIWIKVIRKSSVFEHLQPKSEVNSSIGELFLTTLHEYLLEMIKITYFKTRKTAKIIKLQRNKDADSVENVIFQRPNIKLWTKYFKISKPDNYLL